jgi:putative transposase
MCIRDRIASGILKSYRRLLRKWKKGKTVRKPLKPVFKKPGIRLDEVTFSFKIEGDEIRFSVNYFGERVRFRRKIHKHLRKYLSQGYTISKQPILKPREGKIYLLLLLKKEIVVRKSKNILTVDTNLNNVTWFNSTDNKIKQALTYEQRIRTAYYLKHHRMQLKITKPEKRRRLYRKYRERHNNCIKDLYYKVAKKITDEAERTSSTIILENLKEIRKSINYGKKWNGVLHKWSFRKIQKILEEKAREKGIPIRKVDPAYTSSLCPICGAKMTPNGHRVLKCPKCGLEGDRDAIAVLNLARRCGEIPFPPKAGANEGQKVYPYEVWSPGRFSTANKQKRLTKLFVKYSNKLKRTKTEK